MTALRLLAVLNVLSRSDAERKSLLISAAPRYECPSCSRKSRPPLAERRTPCTDVPLTHFAPPRGEKSGLDPDRILQLGRTEIGAMGNPEIRRTAGGEGKAKLGAAAERFYSIRTSPPKGVLGAAPSRFGR